MRPIKTFLVPLALTVAVATIAAACGGSSKTAPNTTSAAASVTTGAPAAKSGTATTAAGGISETIVNAFADQIKGSLGPSMPDAAVRCLARGAIEVMGVEKLVGAVAASRTATAGAADPLAGLTTADRAKLVSLVFDCGILAPALKTVAADAGVTMTDTQLNCVVAKLAADQTLRSALDSSFLSGLGGVTADVEARAAGFAASCGVSAADMAKLAQLTPAKK